MVDILLVEDNEELQKLIQIFLERGGYAVAAVSSAEEALSCLKRERVKLMLLDIMLPGMDGFALCDKVRQGNNIPIIILSARSEKEDKMNGFSLGADDYVEKPVDMDLLLAKIGALMRRNYELRQQNTILHSGGLMIDKDAKQVTLDGKTLSVTVKEYELLLLLAENPGKVLRKEYLFDQIWGVDSFSENQTLTVHIKMLRDKIEEDPKQPRRIQTVWGVGYKYEEI